MTGWITTEKALKSIRTNDCKEYEYMSGSRKISWKQWQKASKSRVTLIARQVLLLLSHPPFKHCFLSVCKVGMWSMSLSLKYSIIG